MPEPTFIGIGALKAGTTSLYNYLGQHPEIFVSAVKEPKFFGIEGTELSDVQKKIIGVTISDYHHYLELFEGAGSYKAAGEISPNYLSSELAPKKIHARLPAVKLFTILRDPVDRMFSHYLHNVRSGHEQEVGFLPAIRRDEQSRYWHYVPLSRYYAGLKRYFDLFDRSQIEIVYFEDFKADPRRVVSRLYEYLGVDPDFAPDTSVKRNVSYLPRSRMLQRLAKAASPVRAAAKTILPNGPRQRLARRVRSWNQRKPVITLEERREAIPYIENDVQQLAELLGNDLDRWLTP